MSKATREARRRETDITANLRLVGEKSDDIFISWNDIPSGIKFWNVVNLYDVYWERKGCKASFRVKVYNPDKTKPSLICKWLVKIHESEGAYKAEKFKY